MCGAAPIYSDLRRRLAVIAVIVLVTGLWQTLRVSARTVTTLVVEVPATTHLLTHLTPPAAVASSAGPITTRAVPPPAVPRSRAATASAAPPAIRASATPVARPPAWAASATPTPPSPAVEAARPPAPGVYDYRYTVGGASADGTITVSSPSGAEETETETVGGTSRKRTLAWTASAVTIQSSEYGGGTCTWAPALVAWRVPLAVGQQWSTDASCTLPSGRVREQESASVQGVAREMVDGRAVRAWVVQRHTVLTETDGRVVMTIESESSELFDAADGLILFEEGRTVSPNPDGTTTTTDSSMQLVS